VSFAGDCFVADAPRNDIAIIIAVIASPDARDKLREAIPRITISPRIAEFDRIRLTVLITENRMGVDRKIKQRMSHNRYVT